MTPDSFSDGGRYDSFPAAVEHAKRMIDEGADWIDIGGESSRPGAEPVTAEEELRRIIPVIVRVAAMNVKVSVDTMKAAVAQRALDAGAQMVNDITAFRDPEMPRICAEAACEVCLMHMQGEPRSMQIEPSYRNVLKEVLNFLLERTEVAIRAGISADRIWIDPGIGFGKTVDHNITLLHELRQFVESGYPVLLGVSRKSFLGRLDPGAPDPSLRLPGTLAAQVWGQLQGVHMLRVHDVKEARQAALAIQAIAG